MMGAPLRQHSNSRAWALGLDILSQLALLLAQVGLLILGDEKYLGR